MEFIGLIITVAIIVFLVVDAPKHGKSPVLWAILGLIFGLLALGIYLIQTDRKVLGWIIVAFFILIVIGFIILFSIGALLLFNL